MFDFNMVISIDSSSEISTSKIKKITVVRKNRDENDGRAEFCGSNPHSNGDFFSRASLFFFEIVIAKHVIRYVYKIRTSNITTV